jgi:predicted Zn-dependent peptidase
MIVREVLGSGLRLLTESMPHVRSISVGVWLTRGSRHEPEERSGIAHFVEHMLFKGTATRSAEDIAQEIDSIGGQLDASRPRSTPATTSRSSTNTCRGRSRCCRTSSCTRR